MSKAAAIPKLTSRFLRNHWVRCLGCTEPAAIALAAAQAAAVVGGERIKEVSVVCDPRLFRNCFAVGIPRSNGATGLATAAALGALVKRPELGLRILEGMTPELLQKAPGVKVTHHYDPSKADIFVEARVETEKGLGVAVFEGGHQHLVHLEKNYVPMEPHELGAWQESSGNGISRADQIATLARLHELSFADLVGLARDISAADRAHIQDGLTCNRAIVRDGLQILRKREAGRLDPGLGDNLMNTITRHVTAGVYARMSGSDSPVFALCGSGNKGICTSIPVAMQAEQLHLPKAQVEEALALAFLVAGKMTSYLGEVSSACGLPQASAPAITAAFVHMQGGSIKDMDDCIKYTLSSNIGCVCDGAGKGCMLKAASAVSAACHSTMLFSHWGIDLTHTGIFDDSMQQSLVNFEHLVDKGLRHCDEQVLSAMDNQ